MFRLCRADLQCVASKDFKPHLCVIRASRRGHHAAVAVTVITRSVTADRTSEVSHRSITVRHADTHTSLAVAVAGIIAVRRRRSASRQRLRPSTEVRKTKNKKTKKKRPFSPLWEGREKFDAGANQKMKAPLHSCRTSLPPPPRRRTVLIFIMRTSIVQSATTTVAFTTKTARFTFV